MEERLKGLRELMAVNKLDAFVIPTEDAHNSEYIADAHKRREWISGFTGSAGTALVTTTNAFLWTDGRYFLQAAAELPPESWSLKKSGQDETMEVFLSTKLNSTSGSSKEVRVGFDPLTMSMSGLDRLNAAKNVTMVPIAGENWIDRLWGSERPSLPADPAKLHPVQYAGQNVSSKITNIQSKLSSSSGLVVTALDEVAWLFNIRGNDIAFNPVVFAYALVPSSGAAHIYIDPSKLTESVSKALKDSGVVIHDYSALVNITLASKEALAQTLGVDPSTPFTIQVDARSCNASIGASLKAMEPDVTTNRVPSPVNSAKAIKNKAELDGMRNCHIRDGAAVIEYLAWLEEEMTALPLDKPEHPTLDECTAADRLEELRRQMKDCVGLSFPTISSVGPNAAVIHYNPERETAAKLRRDSIYLCDSGGQYLDGTTDITRTVHWGKPTEREIRAYTRVLQGHIALDRVIFPTESTPAPMLDILARTPLWRDGLNYLHGTGHGVGSYLNVHEGPHTIASRLHGPHAVPIDEGMTVTDEPGYYEDGSFGIRIENVLICVAANTPNNFKGGKYLGFEAATVVPMDPALIDVSLLSPDEKTWLNEYHATVAKLTEPFLLTDRARAWLKTKTVPV